MKRFIKNPATGHVVVPGIGPVTEGQILVGNNFEQYVPHLLVEVPSAPRGLPLESRESQTGPRLLTEPAPVGAGPMPSETVQLEEESVVPAAVAAPVKRGRGRPRKYPLSA